VSAPHAGEHGTRRGRVGIRNAGLARDVPQRADGVLQHGQLSIRRGDVAIAVRRCFWFWFRI